MAWLAFTMSAQRQNKELTEERTEKLRKKALRAQVLPLGCCSCPEREMLVVV